MPSKNRDANTGLDLKTIESGEIVPAPMSARATTRRRLPNVAIVEPGAADILAGADVELRNLARRASIAERAASRQTSRARELTRMVNASEASVTLRAENERLKRERVDLVTIIGAYMAGNQELADTLATLAVPNAEKFTGMLVNSSDTAIPALIERLDQRKLYVYDLHGHRVRKDVLDDNGKCPACRREDMRQSSISSDIQTG